MYDWVKTNVRLGGFFISQGAKINIFDIVYVLIAKFECTAGSKRMCGWGLFISQGVKINIFDIVYVLIAKSECKAVSK